MHNCQGKKVLVNYFIISSRAQLALDDWWVGKVVQGLLCSSKKTLARGHENESGAEIIIKACNPLNSVMQSLGLLGLVFDTGLSVTPLRHVPSRVLGESLECLCGFSKKICD